MPWIDLEADLAELFAGHDEPRRADRMEEWSAWQKAQARRYRKVSRERDNFKIRVMRARQEPWVPKPATPRPDLVERNRQLAQCTLRRGGRPRTSASTLARLVAGGFV